MEWTEVIIEINADDIDVATDIANMVVPYGVYIEDYRTLEEETWEIAKNLFADYSNAELDEIFGKGWSFSKLMELTPQEAKAKIEAWEAKQIKVGDEVDICGDKGIVTSFGTDGDRIHVLYLDGIVNSYRKDKDIKKTGRHIDIDGILKQIGGDE